ncbi:MAG: glycosyltransferase [Clostridia bacterium]|nr:glycosyltransferase [Clostridia bacterium]
MKKINIIHYGMVVGGIESSLVNMVQLLNKKYDVEVYTLFPGVWDNRLECKYENLLTSEDEKVFNLGIRKCNKKNIKELIKMSLWAVKYLSGSLAKKLSKKIRPADVNISFLPSRIVMDITKNLKGEKICFVHGDVNYVELTKWKIKQFKKFSKIIAVSESCKNNIAVKYPAIKDKLDFLYNTQNNESILEKSKETKIKFDKNHFNIISCTRLSAEKGHIRSLDALKKLKDSGFDFVWHILGDGVERENIEKHISELKLENNVKLYGNIHNPYPYIKEADLFYLGSFHEAAPMVFAESMILGVPVLTTKTCSANELVGEKGWVCENSEDGIFEGFKEILSNKKLLEEKRKNLKDYHYDNDAIVSKLYNLID